MRALNFAYKALRFLVFFPKFRSHWMLAMDAARREDWSVVEANLREIHEKGYPTDDSLFWRGFALSKMHRFAEAEDDFSAIKGKLSSTEWEESLVYNRAVALIRLNQSGAAAALLLAARDEKKLRFTTELADLLETAQRYQSGLN